MDVRFLILSFLLLLGGCLPESTAPKGKVAGQVGGDNTETTDTNIPPSPTQWNYLAGNFKSITIYASNLNNAYLTGYESETFLSRDENFKNQNYCLVTDYTLAGVKRQMRTLVIPVSYYDFTAKRTVKVFRVDFNVVSNDTRAICSQSLYSYNSLGEYVVDSTVPAMVVYAAGDLCPTCTSRLSSTKVRLFKAQSGLYEVPTQSIKLSDLTLIVDPNSGNTGGGGNGSCSDSLCKSQGYDCCLEEQCVDNAAIRPSAPTLYPDLFRTAEEELRTDPQAWSRYPQIYYICPNYVPTNPGTTTGGTTTGGSTGSTPPGYEQGLTQLKKDLICLDSIKAQSPSIPFHQDLLNFQNYIGNDECLTTDSTEALKNPMHFKNVAKRLYSNCGCSYSDLSDMIAQCPAYYYKILTTNGAGEPTSFECQILTQESIPPTQQVSVSSRSAPHRFFNRDGVEFSSPDQTKVEQEGDVFYYQDEDNNNHTQANFGMNAILGPMSVTLDKALPAKQVNVEIDQMYLIRTISGYYTPCPTCGKDKWHESLTAYPQTNWGVGLQAVGFSTQRDGIDGNITGGNYEDTIFGRACWVPPTMLPFSHQSVSGLDATNQRKARLETQAVLYSNGYQRDWFGFNKGALIGSFDGVSWFAIGNGRLVKSTGKKLYLAINAPFADLASPTMHNVQISLYDGYSTAPQVDYDPQYHLSHSLQNQAGNCQANHMCQTDSDCITRLGWEYACADISQIQTRWPTFDASTSRENVGEEIVTLDQILAQKKLPSGDTKRCVYRGAGAICYGNSQALTDLNKKKTLTCAPNFYCAPLNSSSNISAKVSRFATELEDLVVSRNHLFGQDANVLGRPLNYLGENVSIPTTSRTSLEKNIQANLPNNTSLTTAGICRPGKALPAANQVSLSNPFEQHKNPDSNSNKRTDFINQIASCNASLFTSYRHSSCPVLDAAGNYIQFENSTLPTDYHLLASEQNACGLESISSNLINLNTSLSTLQSYSAFSEIEAVPLAEKVVTTKTLVRDACLRKAGAVCHTDLDCSPNKMHAEVTSYKALHFFGNEAEKTYWEEYLVCGQATPKPSVYDTEATKNYDHTLNRCCREVGKDLTTVTTDTPRSTVSGQYLTYSQGLITSAHPGTNANNAKRYSRLSSVENLGSASRPTLSANTTRDAFGLLTSGHNISKLEQWKTLRDANAGTCCGGGWIRKFSDGSNNWTQNNRLYFDVSNFACLNSRHPILTNPKVIEGLYNSEADVRNLLNRDYNEYCQDTTGTDGSCAQNSFASSSTESNPITSSFGTIEVNTRIGNFGTGNTDFYFKPFSGDAHTGVTMVYNSTTAGARKNLSIRIPSYIPRSAFDDVYDSTGEGTTDQGISLQSENASLVCTKKHALTISSHLDPANDPMGVNTCTSGCCYTFNSSNRILKVAIAQGADNNIRNNESGIRFYVSLGSLNSVVTRTNPANDIYYLNRLSRLELSGIPQITFEPLYCNDDAQSLVPGIFKPSLMKTKGQFESPNNSFIANGRWQTTHHALEQTPVFSEDKFKCCMPLGKTTNNQGNCCSGFGVKDEDSNTFTCALPTGTDLMVYLNPFVSNEGFNLGLAESDFNELTGEPTLSTTVVNKISQIGRQYCVGKKVRQGGAFGNFEPEPQGSRTDVSKRIYQITDSPNDAGQVTNAGATLSTGYNVFNQGFRWNHHLYCTE